MRDVETNSTNTASLKDRLRKRVEIRPRFLIIVLGLVLVCSLISVCVHSVQSKKLAAELSDVEEELSQAYIDNEILEGQLSFSDTDEFIEQEARRRFGYMKEGELRFILVGEE